MAEKVQLNHLGINGDSAVIFGMLGSEVSITPEPQALGVETLAGLWGSNRSR
jgi:hypothetical protein